MSQETEYWYVRDGDAITGPFRRSELDEQRERGVLNWSHDISQDQVFWVSVSSLPPLDSDGRPEGEKRKRGGSSIVAIGAIAAAACLGLWWAFHLGPEPEAVDNSPAGMVATVAPAPAAATVPPPAPALEPPAVLPNPPPVSRVIRSAEAVSELASAIGFVVCARSYETDDGTKTEVPFATGTCFAISGKGYLLTNRHVIEPVLKYRDSEERKAAEKKTGMKVEPVIWVFFKTSAKPPEKQRATIVFQTNPDDEVDLAVLRIDSGAEPLPYYFQLATSGNGNEIKSREVWSLGYPAAARMPIFEEKEAHDSVPIGTKVEELFHESDFEYVTERGIVNVVRKETGKTRKLVEWILHGARISEGNSGGPLITKDATVVGINTIVQRIAKVGITNYFALGMTQIKEILAKNVPELGRELNEPPKVKPDDNPKPSPGH